MSQRFAGIIFFHKTFPNEETLESRSLQLADGVGIGYSALTHLYSIFGEKRGKTEGVVNRCDEGSEITVVDTTQVRL